MEVFNVLKMMADNPQMTFLSYGDFNGHGFGAVDVKGNNPGWEMHPDTDEFFYVVEGEMEITLLENEEGDHYVAPAGSSFVVPRGIWHKPEAPKGAKIIYFTPGESLASDAADPRKQ